MSGYHHMSSTARRKWGCDCVWAVWCYRSEQAYFNSQGNQSKPILRIFFIQTLFKEGIFSEWEQNTLFATGQMSITKSTSPLCLKQFFREHPTPALLRVRFNTGTHLHLQTYSEHASLPSCNKHSYRNTDRKQRLQTLFKSWMLNNRL